MTEKKVKSIFHIVINSNKTINMLSSLSNKQIIQFDDKIKSISRKFHTGMKSRFKKKGFERSNLIFFESYREIGTKKGFIHLDIVCEYDIYTHLNFKRIREFLKAEFGYKAHLDIRGLGSNADKIKNYARKDRMRII